MPDPSPPPNPELHQLSDTELTVDHLAGDWKIYQLRRGHRFSADDMLTAWFATGIVPHAAEQLDLGAGIGSVGLLSLWRLGPHTRLTMVEAQVLSYTLAQRTVALNQLEERVSCRLGDLRDDHVVPETDRWPLVTGSPPYIPLDKGVCSPHPQRAGARMELRGTVADYARRAARAMRPDGWFIFCFSGIDPRAEAAIAAAGLHLRVRQDVYFRAHLPPTVALFAATRTPGEAQRRSPLVIRDQGGAWTRDYLRVRAAMGGPDLLTRPSELPAGPDFGPDGC